MSLWLLMAVSALLLALPVVFRPRTPSNTEFHGVLGFLWNLNAAYCVLIHHLKTETAPLPETGPAILISNHTCNIDNFLLQAGTTRKLGFMISRDYYDVPAFRPFCDLVDCIPVNGTGEDNAAIRSALRALKQGRVLPIFPEGRILPTSGDEIGEAKAGVAFIAIRSKVPVIPAYIRGTPRSKHLLKSFFSPSNTRIVYGKAIDPSVFVIPEGHNAERAALAATTETLMGAIRELRDRVLLEEEGRSTS
jgi:1-acyl-sn-glycerol-3-phosphate acyltransferase